MGLAKDIDVNVNCGEGMTFSQIIALGYAKGEKKYVQNSAKCGLYQAENDLELDSKIELFLLYL